MGKHLGTALALAIIAITIASCTVHQSQTPGLTGPSELGTSITVTATPDSLSQDGASQSSIQVLARDANGRPISGLSLRLDMAVGGTIADYGTLSARTIVTGTDGKAMSIYTAPATPAGSTATGTRVSIVVTPIGGNAAVDSPTIGPGAIPYTVDIRLTPVGIILPPANFTPKFTFTPSAPTMGQTVVFDASTTLDPNNAITSYSWSFGDGASATGKAPTHAYSAAGNYAVTLTVSDAQGRSASATSAVPVGASTLPTASFVYSPTTPQAGQTVVFNGETSTAAAGRTLTSWSWNFGDGSSASGMNASHAFATTGTYNVVLSVVDDLGQRGTATNAVTVSGTSANLTPDFTMSPTNPVSGTPVSFNASTSTPLNQITTFDWDFGDGTVTTGQTTPSITHTFYTSLDATFTIRLTVHNAAGQQATKAQTLSVTSGVGPTVYFTMSPNPATPGWVTIDARGSVYTAPATFQFDYGDGSSLESNSVGYANHIFAAVGTYTIRVTVIDAKGRSASTTHTLQVQ